MVWQNSLCIYIRNHIHIPTHANIIDKYEYIVSIHIYIDVRFKLLYVHMYVLYGCRLHVYVDSIHTYSGTLIRVLTTVIRSNDNSLCVYI